MSAEVAYQGLNLPDILRWKSDITFHLTLKRLMLRFDVAVFPLVRTGGDDDKE